MADQLKTWRANLWEKPPFLRTRKAFCSRQEEEVCELLPVAQLCLTCCSQALTFMQTSDSMWPLQWHLHGHQSTVPPQSASIFIKSCCNSVSVKSWPICGASLALKLAISSSPVPSASAVCNRTAGVSSPPNPQQVTAVNPLASKACFRACNCVRLISRSILLSSEGIKT